MTDAQRKVLGHYLTVEACDPDGAVVRTRGSHAFEKITWRQLDDAIAAALADLDGYAPLRDRVEENRVWIEYGMDRERADIVALLYRDLARDTYDFRWLIDKVRARGPLAPPTPWEVRVAELEGALRAVLDFVGRVAVPRDFAGNIEAARKTLGEES